MIFYLILGDEGVGKTSLLRIIFQDNLDVPESSHPAGVAVTARAISARGKAKESRQLKEEVFEIIYDYIGG